MGGPGSGRKPSGGRYKKFSKNREASWGKGKVKLSKGIKLSSKLKTRGNLKIGKNVARGDW